MRRLANSLILGLVLVSTTGTAGYAAHKKGHMKAATMKCPVCGMTMSAKKTSKTPQMVKVNGKTMYCCSACKMETKAAGKMGTKKQ